MRKVIVDASIAIKWVITEHDTSIPKAMLTGWTQNEDAVLAPILLVSEVTNILYRSVKSGTLLHHDAKKGHEGVKELRKLQERIFQRQGGQIFDNSLELLYESREERDRELCKNASS